MEKEEKEIRPEGTKPLSDEELWFSASAANDLHKYDVDAAYRRFKQHTAPKSVSLRHRWRWLRGAAAAILLLVVAGAAFHQGERHATTAFSDITAEAPLGSQIKLTLPDGSQVWLNAGSRITYSQGFGITGRDLHLEGEGYFEVFRNTDLPFGIHTPELNVTVVGTRFNFRNYPEDQEATLCLLEGKVAVENQVKEMPLQFLLPSDKMSLDKKTGAMQITSANVKHSADWTQDNLIFDEMLLPDIIRELERSYDVSLEIADTALEDERFYGVFNRRKQDIYTVLEHFAKTGRLHYETKDGKIILR